MTRNKISQPGWMVWKEHSHSQHLLYDKASKNMPHVKKSKHFNLVNWKNEWTLFATLFKQVTLTCIDATNCNRKKQESLSKHTPCIPLKQCSSKIILQKVSHKIYLHVFFSLLVWRDCYKWLLWGKLTTAALSTPHVFKYWELIGN